MKKPKYFDIHYKDMVVRVFCKGLNFKFLVLEGENMLTQEDKLNIMRLINGYIGCS